MSIREVQLHGADKQAGHMDVQPVRQKLIQITLLQHFSLSTTFCRSAWKSMLRCMARDVSESYADDS